MPAISLTSEEVLERFGVEIAIENFPSNLTEEEERNAKTVLNYMAIAYSPTKNTGGDSVKEYCASGNKFEAPSTFPTAHTAEEYAESHSHVMSSLKDLHIVKFQVVNVKESFVSLRYEATGSHIGEDHNGIKPTKKRGHWSGSGNFILNDEGKIQQWWKDWDKNNMWSDLGWVRMKSETEVDFV